METRPCFWYSRAQGKPERNLSFRLTEIAKAGPILPMKLWPKSPARREMRETKTKLELGSEINSIFFAKLEELGEPLVVKGKGVVGPGEPTGINMNRL